MPLFKGGAGRERTIGFEETDTLYGRRAKQVLRDDLNNLKITEKQVVLGRLVKPKSHFTIWGNKTTAHATNQEHVSLVRIEDRAGNGECIFC
jgi:hypothetical protein